MSPLEQLFVLEIEFHRKLRQEAPGTADAAALHTSYALQCGYEPLLRIIGRVTAQDLDRLAHRFMRRRCQRRARRPRLAGQPVRRASFRQIIRDSSTVTGEFLLLGRWVPRMSGETVRNRSVVPSLRRLKERLMASLASVRPGQRVAPACWHRL